MTANEQELIKQAKRAYKKEWRAKNKDKIKAANVSMDSLIALTRDVIKKL
jgi:hypothetical protein